MAPWTPPTSETGTYSMHCHCGALRLTMRLSPPLFAEETQNKTGPVATAIECQCSHCARHGGLMVHPLAKDVQFTKGVEEGKRREYTFGRRLVTHWSCADCGCYMGGDLRNLVGMLGPEERYTINLRMLKDFDLAKITSRVENFMKLQEPKYQIAE